MGKAVMKRRTHFAFVRLAFDKSRIIDKSYIDKSYIDKSRRDKSRRDKSRKLNFLRSS